MSSLHKLLADSRKFTSCSILLSGREQKQSPVSVFSLPDLPRIAGVLVEDDEILCILRILVCLLGRYIPKVLSLLQTAH